MLMLRIPPATTREHHFPKEGGKVRSLLTLLSSSQPRMTDCDNQVLPSWKEGRGRKEERGWKSLWKVFWSNLLLSVREIKIIPLNAILPHDKTQILRK